jgi:hypothetical protein
MNYRLLLSLTLGISLLQLTSSAQAAPASAFKTAAVIGSLEGSSSGGGADLTLNKARWSLPSCAAIQSAAPAKAAEEEEEFDTPASVEARAKKAAALKKANRATTATAARSATAATAAQNKSIDPTETESAPEQAAKPEAPFVRLTLSPAAKEGTRDEAQQAPAKIARKQAAPAPGQTANPLNDPSSGVQQSSVSARPDYSSAPMPGSGAPVPGGTSGTPGGNIRPSKTAAKSNTQANAGDVLKNSKFRA